MRGSEVLGLGVRLQLYVGWLGKDLMGLVTFEEALKEMRGLVLQIF